MHAILYMSWSYWNATQLWLFTGKIIKWCDIGTDTLSSIWNICLQYILELFRCIAIKKCYDAGSALKVKTLKSFIIFMFENTGMIKSSQNKALPCFMWECLKSLLHTYDSWWYLLWCYIQVHSVHSSLGNFVSLFLVQLFQTMSLYFVVHHVEEAKQPQFLGQKQNALFWSLYASSQSPTSL